MLREAKHLFSHIASIRRPKKAVLTAAAGVGTRGEGALCFAAGSLPAAAETCSPSHQDLPLQSSTMRWEDIPSCSCLKRQTMEPAPPQVSQCPEQQMFSVGKQVHFLLHAVTSVPCLTCTNSHFTFVDSSSSNRSSDGAVQIT